MSGFFRPSQRDQQRMRRFMSVAAAGAAADIGGVVVLLHFDGTDASTTFTDVSGKTWTANGNAQIDTAQSKFGGASGLFDGTGDWIETADSTDFFLSADFTLETWYRPNAIGARQFLCGQGNSGASDIRCLLEVSATGKVIFYSQGTASTVDSTTTLLTAGTWAHIAVTRQANTYTIWINGVSAASAFSSTTITDFAGPFTIGRCGAFTSLNANGWFDDFRLTKGTARYTGTFTPPTAALPDN